MSHGMGKPSRMLLSKVNAFGIPPGRDASGIILIRCRNHCNQLLSVHKNSSSTPCSFKMSVSHWIWAHPDMESHFSYMHCWVELVWVIRMSPWQLPLEVFWGHPNGKRPLGRPRAHWRNCVSNLVWEFLNPQAELEGLNKEKNIWATQLDCCHHDSDPNKKLKTNGWMDGYYLYYLIFSSSTQISWRQLGAGTGTD